MNSQVHSQCASKTKIPYFFQIADVTKGSILLNCMSTFKFIWVVGKKLGRIRNIIVKISLDFNKIWLLVSFGNCLHSMSTWAALEDSYRRHEFSRKESTILSMENSIIIPVETSKGIEELWIHHKEVGQMLEANA